MEDNYNLQRFLDAQENSYAQAIKEIRNGRKTSHWMWYIFPQFKGLGRSSTSIKYAIKSKEEAIAYFLHPILHHRLIEITQAVLSIDNKSAYEIYGTPDDKKLKSCMTLFESIQEDTDIFELVLTKFFDGKRCKRTLKLLQE